MKLIVMVDDNMGMMFNRRRQSHDLILTERLSKMAGDTPVWMNSYTALYYQIHFRNAAVSVHFMEDAGTDDYAICENESVAKYIDRVDQLYVYKWNREYPSTLKLDIDLSDWKLISSTDFAGSSHENITEEIYTK